MGFQLSKFGRLTGSLFGSTARPIALDFGSAALKALQIENPDAPQLVAAASLSTPDELLTDHPKRMAWQLEQLPKLLRSAPFRGRKVIVGMPATQTFCKHVQLQIADPSATADLVAATVAGQLNCLPDSLVCRHVEVGPTATGSAGKTEIVALAASRAMIQKLMNGLRSARLEPVGIQPEPVAILRAFDHITRRLTDHETTSLYLDLGSACTRVFIAHGTNLVFAKTIALGGQFLDSHVAKQLKCDLTSARQHRLGIKVLSTSHDQAPVVTGNDMAAGGLTVLAAAMKQAEKTAGGRSMSGEVSPPPDLDEPTPVMTDLDRRGEVYGAPKPPPNCQPLEGARLDPADLKRVDLRDALATLTDDIHLCLRYHDSLFPGRQVTRTIFVGGEAKHTALCQHIARALKAPAHVADPLARLARTGNPEFPGVDLRQPQPAWAVALGLCLSPTDL